MKTRLPFLQGSFALLCVVAASLPQSHAAIQGKPAGGPVSYYKDIRPIFQANCQSCHQPAKPKGGYVMTDFQKLLAGGEKDGVAVVPGMPDKGSLIEQITPTNGSAEMPKNKPPLSESELSLVRRWVQEGAKDDTPADAKKHFDAAHPPIYSRLPVVASVDFSPDGSLLAVAGFHEVLLHSGDGSKLVARLVGVSERIQSIRFSPDGKWLAAAGGDPSRLGELQIWEIATQKLKLSLPVTWDTIYGVSWSPDSRLVAFGCADNTVRSVEVATGKQVLQMGSHNDLVLDTAFSQKGDHIVSVGRDMTAKLSELAEQRFVDNITSITPGALRGGMHAVDRHPSDDIIVVGGADGAPQLFKIFRTTARKIGDNANLLRRYPEMTGRVFSTRFSADGKKFAAGSALNGRGEVSVFSTEGEINVPEEVSKIRALPEGKRTPKQAEALKAFEQSVPTYVARTTVEGSAIYAVAFHPDSRTVAAAGSDGRIRLIDSVTGTVSRTFDSVPLQELSARQGSVVSVPVVPKVEGDISEKSPRATDVVALESQPLSVAFTRKNDYVQLVLTARYSDGTTSDVTRAAQLEVSGPVVEVTSRGQLHPKADGSAEVRVKFGGKTLSIPVQVSGAKGQYEADFVRDVNPVMTKLGCNQGSCHGAKEGKGGFKLSLRGYDPEYDIRSLTDDMASRRVAIASPDDSLMLLKAVAEVPHEGGRRTNTDEKSYQILRQWVAEGAQFNAGSSKATKIEILPENPVVQQIGGLQQFRVLAHYADGTVRDVSQEAFVESGNTDVASVSGAGLVTTLRRGEAPMLARYEGNYVATTVTVMGDRSGFRWTDPVTWSRVDELVAAKWKRMQTEPSDLASDSEFLRRVYLDLTGLPPSVEKLRQFLTDTRDTRTKREAVIDELVGSVDFVENWTNKWSDLLQVNSKFLGKEGAETFRAWIRSNIDKNVPYDQFVREIVTATGSNNKNPAASYWKILRQPAESMENTTHLFLATRFNCNKCHDHPFERWTQDQYYQTAAYFAQFSLTSDPASGDKKIGGTAVEGAKPLWEVVSENPSGEIKHDRTGKITAPVFPFSAKFEVTEKATRREQLAAWMTSPDNRYFASSYVNRIWGYLLGRGIIEPLDDIRAGNPPTNPELLDHLTQEFIRSKFDTRVVFKTICKSRTYQLSLKTNRWNEDDTVNYSHAVARRLSAETLFDSVFKVTGSKSVLPGVAAGARAAQMVDSSSEGAGGFLATLGKPARESTCECERSSNLGLGSVMALLSGPVVSGAIQDPKNDLAQLVAAQPDDTKLINELFERVLSREATSKEVESTQRLLGALDHDHESVDKAWIDKEKEQAPIIAEAEKARERAIATASEKLEKYESVTKYLREELEKARVEREKRAVLSLKALESTHAGRVEGWIQEASPAASPVRWSLLQPKTATATGDVKLTVEKDGTVVSGGGTQNSEYSVTVEADATDVTGFLLEVLPDPAAPKFGPGRSKDGNFILNEFTVRMGSLGKGADPAKLNFTEARASGEQDKFPASAAIDGKEDEVQNGWSIGGLTTRRHTIALKLESVIKNEGKARLIFRLVQRGNNGLLIARFRIYATTAADPLHEGVPRVVAESSEKASAERSADEKLALSEYVRLIDVEYWRQRKEVLDAKTPLVMDPAYKELKDTLAEVSKPIRLDPVLVQMRADVKASKQQLCNKRLTMVQDLAWALINNPAFLFNR
ncbi:MAG: DUF1549 domain-containing protein [Verrucomicrobiota bacterium]